MPEYIEREAVIAVIYGQHIGGKEACENARPNTYGADLREIVADIEDIPAADVQPVRHGRWLKIDDFSYEPIDWVLCNRCKAKIPDFDYPYCPNCWAKMEEVDEDD